MHSWGDPGVDWKGINDAAEYIGGWLRTYARVEVRCIKEKFGTVRVYCSFGWGMFYSIWRPGYVWFPKWWPARFDMWLADSWVLRSINHVLIPLQMKAYVWRYRKAVERWPHLYKEIVSMADFGELFEGVTFAGQKKPYKHSDFWQTIGGSK